MATYNDEITFKIIEHICVLRTNEQGWRRELNLIAWYDRPPKYDIREWTPDHTKSTRGITLTEYEMELILKAMGERKEVFK